MVTSTVPNLVCAAVRTFLRPNILDLGGLEPRQIGRFDGRPLDGFTISSYDEVKILQNHILCLI